MKIYPKTFSFFTPPITNVNPAEELNLSMCCEIVRDFFPNVLKLRSITDKILASNFKRNNLYYVTFSGTFKKRSDKELIKHSNLICIDIDGIQNPEYLKQQLSNDPHIAMIFISPSGKGLKIVFGMEINFHSQLEWYKAIANYLTKNYQIDVNVIDTSCSNVSRACFISYDTQPYLVKTWEDGIPIIDGEYFQEKEIIVANQKFETSYNSYKSDEPDKEFDELLDFSNRDNEINFELLIKRTVGKLGDYNSPRQTWLHSLACRCNRFGMDELICFKFMQKHFINHPVSTNPAKPLNSNQYIILTIKDAYKRYHSDFGVWKPLIKKKDLKLTGESISSNVYKNLPLLLKEVVSRFNGHDKDLLLLSSLSVLSSALPGIHGIYDGKTIYPNLMTFATANAAAGKGIATFSKQLVSGIEKHLEEIHTNELEVYYDQLKKYEKKEIEQRPIQPKRQRHLLSGNSSSAALYTALCNNQKGTLIFETEADTLINTMKNDWGNFSDILRKAFHNEPSSFLRTDEAKSGYINNTNISVFLAGTTNQFFKMFPDIENGTFSRFIIYSFRSDVFWKDVFDKNFDGYEKKLSELAEQVTNIYKICLLKENVVPTFYLSEKQRIKFSKFFSGLNERYYSLHGEKIIASIRRLGTVTFKVAMILSILKYYDEVIKSHWNGMCKDEELDAALLLIESLASHVATVIPHLRNSSIGGNINSTALKYFDYLPNQFNRRLADGVAKSINLNLKTAESYLKKLVEGKMLDHEHNLYKKKN